MKKLVMGLSLFMTIPPSVIKRYFITYLPWKDTLTYLLNCATAHKLRLMISRRLNYLMNISFQYFWRIKTQGLPAHPVTLHTHYMTLRYPPQKCMKFFYLRYHQITRNRWYQSPSVTLLCFSLLIPICHLFISSITSGKISSQWCTHCIVPVHKSGDRTLVSNYRLISLLCILSKVLERIIYNHIMNFTIIFLLHINLAFCQRNRLYNNCCFYWETVRRQK